VPMNSKKVSEKSDQGLYVASFIHDSHNCTSNGLCDAIRPRVRVLPFDCATLYGVLWAKGARYVASRAASR
jgi:hypothetical protein